MSADTHPISPARFAEAVRDLSLATLHLKALEIRNSILHLQYSNAQLKPYAEGAATTLDAADASLGRPDPDCVEAIRENDVVIARMEEPSQHPAWLDGTFQVGTIRNGEIQLDTTPAQPAPQTNGTGGRLSDDELRRAMEEQIRGLGDDDNNDNDGGMHL
ncbi:hypothetical protein ColKHC_00797 [Colletotrichum higginsianum]|nr:hypothetical protein ColKHC_00797 [Colletotrichum higginsianum]